MLKLLLLEVILDKLLWYNKFVWILGNILVVVIIVIVIVIVIVGIGIGVGRIVVMGKIAVIKYSTINVHISIVFRVVVTIVIVVVVAAARVVVVVVAAVGDAVVIAVTAIVVIVAVAYGSEVPLHFMSDNRRGR